MSIQKLCKQLGTLQTTEPGNRFSCDEPFCIWYVAKGSIDIFFTKTDNADGNKLYPFLRVTENKIFIGNSYLINNNSWNIIARNCSNTLVYKIVLPSFQSFDLNELETLRQIFDCFIIDISQLLSSQNFPVEYMDIIDKQALILEPGNILSCSKNIRWIQLFESVVSLNNYGEYLSSSQNDFLPLTTHTWINITTPGSGTLFDTLTLMQKNKYWQAFYSYYNWIVQLSLDKLENVKLQENIIFHDKIQNNQIHMRNALITLTHCEEELQALPSLQGKYNYLYYSICKQVTDFYQLPLNYPLKSFDNDAIKNFIYLMDISTIFYRKIYLKDNWYDHNHGPMFTVERSTSDPVVLIPGKNKSYLYFDKDSTNAKLLTHTKADKLISYAYTIYRNFGHKILTGWELIKFGLQYTRSDSFLIGLCFSFIALLSFIPPILTQIVFDNLTTFSEGTQIIQVAIILAVVILSLTCFELTKRYALLRLETKFDSQIQTALWARILKLPMSFFHNFTPGELSAKITYLVNARMILTGPLINLTINAVFSLSNIVLLFYYSSITASTVVAFIMVVLIAYSYGIRKRLRIEEEAAIDRERYFGILGEFFSAITKIRSAGAEYKAFFYWSKSFAKLQSALNKSQRVSVILKAMLEASSLLTFAIMYLTISCLSEPSRTFTTGTFLAFNIVVTQIVFVGFMVLNEINRVIGEIPKFLRSQLFVQTLPEMHEQAQVMVDIRGNIEISNISFKYPDMQHWILKDLNIKINAGEYIAFVGSSGCGKSTLLKLLLRLEIPNEGAIYYDNNDLQQVNIDMLRKEMGVVLQNDQLIPGDIYSNIAPAHDLSLGQVWEIADKVGIANDIENMPMQLRTMINAEGSTISGGQKERILIARAIAHQPKILILDEATRSLDNSSQKHVMNELDKMKMTRIVVAHRLSTLINVDRIYVIEKGQIVEVGSYTELISKNGSFYHLAQKQLI